MFRRSLRELGYAEGHNIAIEYRSAEGTPQLLELANALVRDKVEVIVAGGGPAARSAKEATKTVPIVFATSGDPVESGFVDSIARPGGTMTGTSWLSFELVGKRLELLKEAAPGVSRVAILSNPQHPGEQRELRETQSSARAHGNNPRISSSKNARRIRRRLRCPKQAKRQWSPGLPRRCNVGQSTGDHRLRRQAPTAEHVRLERVCGSRRPHVLWAEP